MWVLARSNKLKEWYWRQRTDQNVGSGKSEQTENGYGPHRKNWNKSVGQTEHTRKCCWPDARRDQNFFQTIDMSRTTPAVRDPSLSGQCLFWIADIILGFLIAK